MLDEAADLFSKFSSKSGVTMAKNKGKKYGCAEFSSVEFSIPEFSLKDGDESFPSLAGVFEGRTSSLHEQEVLVLESQTGPKSALGKLLGSTKTELERAALQKGEDNDDEDKALQPDNNHVDRSQELYRNAAGSSSPDKLSTSNHVPRRSSPRKLSVHNDTDRLGSSNHEARATVPRRSSPRRLSVHNNADRLGTGNHEARATVPSRSSPRKASVHNDTDRLGTSNHEAKATVTRRGSPRRASLHNDTDRLGTSSHEARATVSKKNSSRRLRMHNEADRLGTSNHEARATVPKRGSSRRLGAHSDRDNLGTSNHEGRASVLKRNSSRRLGAHNDTDKLSDSNHEARAAGPKRKSSRTLGVHNDTDGLGTSNHEAVVSAPKRHSSRRLIVEDDADGLGTSNHEARATVQRRNSPRRLSVHTDSDKLGTSNHEKRATVHKQNSSRRLSMHNDTDKLGTSNHEARATVPKRNSSRRLSTQDDTDGPGPSNHQERPAVQRRNSPRRLSTNDGTDNQGAHNHEARAAFQKRSSSRRLIPAIDSVTETKDRKQDPLPRRLCSWSEEDMGREKVASASADDLARPRSYDRNLNDLWLLGDADGPREGHRHSAGNETHEGQQDRLYQSPTKVSSLAEGYIDGAEVMVPPRVDDRASSEFYDRNASDLKHRHETENSRESPRHRSGNEKNGRKQDRRYRSPTKVCSWSEEDLCREKVASAPANDLARPRSYNRNLNDLWLLAETDDPRESHRHSSGNEKNGRKQDRRYRSPTKVCSWSEEDIGGEKVTVPAKADHRATSHFCDQNPSDLWCRGGTENSRERNWHRPDHEGPERSRSPTKVCSWSQGDIRERKQERRYRSPAKVCSWSQGDIGGEKEKGPGKSEDRATSDFHGQDTSNVWIGGETEDPRDTHRHRLGNETNGRKQDSRDQTPRKTSREARPPSASPRKRGGGRQAPARSFSAFPQKQPDDCGFADKPSSPIKESKRAHTQ